MAAWSPTLEGLRSLFRRPALPLAEVMWRWSFGAAACTLLGLGFLEYLNTLPVSGTDLLLMRTRQPWLIFQAFAHILRGSGLRFAAAGFVLFSALAFLWILFASLGRAATLDNLLSYIRMRARDVATAAGSEPVPSEPWSTWRFRSLAGLHFLRAALAFAACASCVGAFILAGIASSADSPHPGIVFLLVLAMLMLIGLVWSSISWFLSLASIFVVRQSKDAFSALSAAVALCRDRMGPVAAVGTWFGLAHLVLFMVATSVVTFPLAFVRVLPIGFVLLSVLCLTFLYFAIVDALYVGRLAGYVAILEAPAVPVVAVPLPQVVVAPVSASIQASALSIQPELSVVDQDELILSDRATQSSTHEPVLATRDESSMVDQDEPILSDLPESSSDAAPSNTSNPPHD